MCTRKPTTDGATTAVPWRAAAAAFALRLRIGLFCATAVLFVACARTPAPATGAHDAAASTANATISEPILSPDTRLGQEEALAVAPELSVQSEPTKASKDYKIATDDLLEIKILGVPDLDREVRVNSSGQISLPLIGVLRIGGLTSTQVEKLVAEQYGNDYLQDPQVSVFIKEFTTQRVTIDGAVVKPGIYPVSGQLTLLRALALAGGGSELADLEHVMLFRVTPEGQVFAEEHDVLQIRTGSQTDPLLQNDDVVVVNRNPTRALLRDSALRDLVDFLNPFSSSVYQMNNPR